MFSIDKLEAFLKDVINLRKELDDVIASNYPNLYADWTVDKNYNTDDRVCYNNIIYKVLQSHTSQAGWNPETAVSLYAKILTSTNPDEILPWQQPDSTNAYMTGDKVQHNGKTWVSNCDNNVWEPGVYGWDEVII